MGNNITETLITVVAETLAALTKTEANIKVIKWELEKYIETPEMKAKHKAIPVINYKQLNINIICFFWQTI